MTYIYVVHGTNDPIDGDNVVFETKADALNYANNYENSVVELVEVDEDGNATGNKIPVKGGNFDESALNSCEGDATWYQVEVSTMDDNGGLVEETYLLAPGFTAQDLADELKISRADNKYKGAIISTPDIASWNTVEQNIDEFRAGAEYVKIDSTEDYTTYEESFDDEPVFVSGEPEKDEIESDSFAEELFSELYKRGEEKKLNEDAKYAGDYKGFSIYKQIGGGYWAQKGYTDDVFDKEFDTMSEIRAAIDELISSRGRSGMRDQFGDDDDLDEKVMRGDTPPVTEQEPTKPSTDVPVVPCKINPVITHSEDEKPLNENTLEEASDIDSILNSFESSLNSVSAKKVEIDADAPVSEALEDNPDDDDDIDRISVEDLVKQFD